MPGWAYLDVQVLNGFSFLLTLEGVLTVECRLIIILINSLPERTQVSRGILILGHNSHSPFH